MASKTEKSASAGNPNNPAEDAKGFAVNIQEEGSVLRVVEITVEPPLVDRAFEHAYRDVAKRSRVKGFRPGKAPRSVLRKMYGPALAEDLERTLVSQTLPQALQDADIAPVAEPAIEADPPRENESFRYVARIEVKPEIELGEIRGLPAQQPAGDVTEEDVERELEALRERNAPLVEEPEGTPIAEGHTITFDYVGRIDGKAFEGGSAQEAVLEIGSGRFIPGFEDQLIGKRAGEDGVVQVSFPEDYPAAELAGKAAEFDVHIVNLKKRQIPELDDEFAKDLGDFDSLDALRDRLRTDLTSQHERAARNALQTSLVDALIERHPFDVPAGMVERRLNNRLATAHRQMQGSVDHDALHQQMARWREEWRSQAERDVREALLYEAIARQEGIEADDAAIDDKIESIAQEAGGNDPRLRDAYKDPEVREAIRGQLCDEQVLDFLIREAKIEEVSGT